MEFERLYAPSLKELFIKQLQGLILSGELAGRWSMAAFQNWQGKAFWRSDPAKGPMWRITAATAIWIL